jgi:hypothetical protein
MFGLVLPLLNVKFDICKTQALASNVVLNSRGTREAVGIRLLHFFLKADLSLLEYTFIFNLNLLFLTAIYLQAPTSMD